jgi:uncharacterized membrane protein YphA (DoxX/SURF4 family)
MTIWNLIGTFAAVGILLTIIMRWRGIPKNLITSFLQNFCGVWFFVSGLVKAIDPTGTGFKMEQYFASFEQTFSGTWLKSICGIFPWLSAHSIGFSIFMIVLELALGLMLIFGNVPKWTARLFFVILVFFTVLTGYTFLTGFVPQDQNFFNFSAWGPFVKENMKVTDCGCFGDFLKLDPRVSFLKDLFLLIPGFYFLFRHKTMHQLFSAAGRGSLLIISTVLFIAYCCYYSFMAEPAVDFRPFREGVNIRDQRQAELDAESNRKITHWRLLELATNSVQTITDEQYMSNLANYPKTAWKVIEQVKDDPKVPSTKLTDFYVYGKDDADVSEEILGDAATTVWVLMYKVPSHSAGSQTITVQDTIFHTDSIRTVDQSTGDTILVLRQVVDSLGSVQKTINAYSFDPTWLARLKNQVQPLTVAANAAKVKVVAITPMLDPSVETALMEQSGINYPILHADDILLKTIMRSNPGVLVIKNGQIIAKYHFNHLPTEAEWKQVLNK